MGEKKIAAAIVHAKTESSWSRVRHAAASATTPTADASRMLSPAVTPRCHRAVGIPFPHRVHATAFACVKSGNVSRPWNPTAAQPAALHPTADAKYPPQRGTDAPIGARRQAATDRDEQISGARRVDRPTMSLAIAPREREGKHHEDGNVSHREARDHRWCHENPQRPRTPHSAQPRCRERCHREHQYPQHCPEVVRR